MENTHITKVQKELFKIKLIVITFEMETVTILYKELLNEMNCNQL